MTKALTTNETDLYIAWLDAKREHAIAILDGLSEQVLRTPLVPSGWSPLGMIGHLEGLERFWFQMVVSGNLEATSDIEGEIEWQVDPAIPAKAVFDAYRAEIERSNEVIRKTPLDAAPRRWPDFFGEWQLENLREIILHTMTEVAAHAGHLDICRELVDGRQWLVLEV